MSSRFERTATGTFHNCRSINMVWQEPGWFEYVPDCDAPFFFTDSKGCDIKPGQFFFDGGSTPVVLHIFRKFSPWFYTPVALVHDWLSETQACKCPITDLEGAVRIQQEALKTMMLMKEEWMSLTVFNASRRALLSRKARRIWNTQEDDCPIPISRKKERLKL